MLNKYKIANTHKTPNSILVMAKCQYSVANPPKAVMRLHINMHANRNTFLFRFLNSDAKPVESHELIENTYPGLFIYLVV